MARLPVYTNQTIAGTPETVSVQQDTSIAEATNRLGATTQNVAIQWQETQNQAETLDGKNKLAEQNNAIFQEAEDFNDYTNPKEIDAKKKELMSRMDKMLPSVADGFTNDINKNNFQMSYEKSVMDNKASLDGIFRSKYIDNNNVQLVKSENTNKQAYISSGDEAYKASYIEDLTTSANTGLISQEDKATAELDVDDWEYERVMSDASVDPRGVLENLDSYDLDASEKAEVIKDASAIIAQYDKLVAAGVKGEEGSLTRESYDRFVADTNLQSRFKEFRMTDSGIIKNPDLNNLSSLIEYRQELKNNRSAMSESKYKTINSKTRNSLYRMATNMYGEKGKPVDYVMQFWKDDIPSTVGNNVFSNIDFRVAKEGDEYNTLRADLYEETAVELSKQKIDLDDGDVEIINKAQEIANKVYVDKMRSVYGGLPNITDENLLRPEVFENIEMNRKRSILYPEGVKTPPRKEPAEPTKTDDIFKELGL